MLSVHLVLEICGLKLVVSFNFAPSAPHVKQRVKSCEPRAAAATSGDVFNDRMFDIMNVLQRERKFCYLLGDLNIDFLKAEDHRATGDLPNVLYFAMYFL